MPMAPSFFPLPCYALCFSLILFWGESLYELVFKFCALYSFIVALFYACSDCETHPNLSSLSLRHISTTTPSSAPPMQRQTSAQSHLRRPHQSRSEGLRWRGETDFGRVQNEVAAIEDKEVSDFRVLDSKF